MLFARNLVVGFMRKKEGTPGRLGLRVPVSLLLIKSFIFLLSRRSILHRLVRGQSLLVRVTRNASETLRCVYVYTVPLPWHAKALHRNWTTDEICRAVRSNSLVGRIRIHTSAENRMVFLEQK